jgi:hypothetical protein
MEIAPPVDMITQELDRQLLEQAVVFAVRTEKTRIKARIAHGELVQWFRELDSEPFRKLALETIATMVGSARSGRAAARSKYPGGGERLR